MTAGVADDSSAGRPNAGFTYRGRVPQGDDGTTLLDHLARRHAHSTRAAWRERIVAGAVAVDGARSAPDARLAAGQEIAWARPGWVEPEAPRGWALLHRDADLLLAAKPAGLPTLPGGGYLEETLLYRVRRLHPEAAVAHRLDRGASGVVVFARGPAAAAALAEAFRTRRVAKTYRALVAGYPREDEFAVTTPIGRVDLPGGSSAWVAATASRGAAPVRAARTEVRVLERRAEGTSLVEAHPITGRPHQVRIHLAAAGHPLAGDPLYGAGGGLRIGAPPPGATGYHLHALRIGLPHPSGGRLVTIECAPPARLRSADEGGAHGGS